jgi:hypothetical protein
MVRDENPIGHGCKLMDFLVAFFNEIRDKK